MTENKNQAMWILKEEGEAKKERWTQDSRMWF